MPGLSFLALGGTSMDDDSLAFISGSFSCLGRLAHLDLSSNKLHLEHDETNLPLSFSALTALEVKQLRNYCLRICVGNHYLRRNKIVGNGGIGMEACLS